MGSSTISNEDRQTFRVEDGKLDDGEVFWRDLQPWLKEQGYTLRSRYQSDWVASWLRAPDPTKPWNKCEDGFTVWVSLCRS